MNTIKCPKCECEFNIDKSEYNLIVEQVRTDQFIHDVETWKNEYEKLTKIEFDSKIKDLEHEHETKIKDLEHEHETKITNIESVKDKKISNLEDELKTTKEKIDSAIEITKKDNEIALLKKDEQIKGLNEVIKLKDDQIASLKDYRDRLSTKMIGETLENHSKNSIDILRSWHLFNSCEFEKDNQAIEGSKGDFIFRDYILDEKGNKIEFVSIMFEMKDEAEDTDDKNKHKNEDFFKKLDKDRKQKNCEYACLVSRLEKDNELYNQGIVDVSYKYEKMYVIRPVMIIPFLTMLRNAAYSSASYKLKFEEERQKNIDISKFEDKLTEFKEKFVNYYTKSSEKFDKAIEEIDATIKKLEKVKEFLTGSFKYMKNSNEKLDDLTIKKLTYRNPTMQQMFKEAAENKPLAIKEAEEN